MTTRVININTAPAGWMLDGRHVYCGRAMRRLLLPGSIWQNPYHIGKHGNREQVIDLYRLDMLAWRDAEPERFAAELEQLRGKVLVCWCKPLACHCDVLVALLGEREPQPEQMGLFGETGQ